MTLLGAPRLLRADVIRRVGDRRTSCAIVALCLLLVGVTVGCDSIATKSTEPTILFAPVSGTSTYLMNLDGQKLHEWSGSHAPGYSVYLLSNGHLLRTNSLPERPLSALRGSNGGRVEMLDWNSNVVWQFDYATREGQQHHDVFYMPHNKHVLLLAWEVRSAAEALAAGRDPATIPAEGELWVDKVVEVDPATNQVVWEWRTWDHLVPVGGAAADYPERIDVNHVAPGTDLVDWTHANSVYYDADLDQVMISVRNFSEVWVVDRGTTTSEAAGSIGGRRGRGGDLLYRWGNARAHGVARPQQLYGQHDAHWIPAGLPGAGNVLLFDNGDATGRPWSRVVELAPSLLSEGSYLHDLDGGFGPAAPHWEYMADPPESVFAAIMSSAQRLASGNTLLTVSTQGRFLEVTPTGETAWSYIVSDASGTTGHLVFRAIRYEAGYEGLTGRVLESQGPLLLRAVASGARATAESY